MQCFSFAYFWIKLILFLLFFYVLFLFTCRFFFLCNALDNYLMSGKSKSGNIIISFLSWISLTKVGLLKNISFDDGIPINFCNILFFLYSLYPSIDATETAAAFSKHFEAEVKRHGHVTCLSLVEQNGKEKVIADAYLNNILTLDSPSLTFVTFDFHEYW